MSEKRERNGRRRRLRRKIDDDSDEDSADDNSGIHSPPSSAPASPGGGGHDALSVGSDFAANADAPIDLFCGSERSAVGGWRPPANHGVTQKMSVPGGAAVDIVNMFL